MKFKGTKGKWENRHSENNPQWVVVGTRLGGKYKIARCPYLDNKTDMEEAKANAQLIAAAPELLEALLEFKKYYESDFFRLVSEDGRTQAAWTTKMNKAINKALGQ